MTPRHSNLCPLTEHGVHTPLLSCILEHMQDLRGLWRDNRMVVSIRSRLEMLLHGASVKVNKRSHQISMFLPSAPTYSQCPQMSHHTLYRPPPILSRCAQANQLHLCISLPLRGAPLCQPLRVTEYSLGQGVSAGAELNNWVPVPPQRTAAKSPVSQETRKNRTQCSFQKQMPHISAALRKARRHFSRFPLKNGMKHERERSEAGMTGSIVKRHKVKHG